MSAVEQRVTELRALIKQYSYEYYVLGISSVSDAQFDALVSELRTLEQSPARRRYGSDRSPPGPRRLRAKLERGTARNAAGFCGT